MRNKWTFGLAASVLVAAAGVFYCRNASHCAAPGASAAANKSDLRDALNSSNAPKKHVLKRVLTQESDGDVSPAQVATQPDSPADQQLKALADLIKQQGGGITLWAYPKGEPVTKTEMMDDVFYDTGEGQSVSGPMSLSAFVAARRKYDSSLKGDPASSAALNAVSDAVGRLSGNFEFYIVHTRLDEGITMQDDVIIDTTNNQEFIF